MSETTIHDVVIVGSGPRSMGLPSLATYGRYVWFGPPAPGRGELGWRGVGVGNGDVGSGDGVGSDCPQAATTSAAAPVAALLRKKRRLSTLRAGVFVSLAALGG